MTKEELQTNLISLVPSEIRKSKELKKSDKVLLGQLVYLYGMDKAKANGYVFRSNADLEKDTQLSKQTVQFAINRLIKFGAINRTVGSRTEGASVYTLNFNVSNMNGDDTESKIIPINHPYISKDEVERMIAKMRAEFQKQINDLRDEIAVLKGMKTDETIKKSSVSEGKIIPMQSKIIPQIQNTEKEITNPIVTGSNSSMGLPICGREGKATFIEVEGNDPDEIAPSNEIDQTGDVCDFQNKIEGEVDTFQPEDNNNEQGEINNPNGEVKQSQPDEEIKQSQATANKADQSLATPQMGKLSINEREHAQIANKVANPDDEQQTIEYLTNLEMTLRDINTNLNHDEVIALAGKLSTIFTKQGNDYDSPISKAVASCVGLLANFQCDNLTILEELKDALADNLTQINGNSTLIARTLNIRKVALTKQASEIAQISTIDTPDKETISNEPKQAQKRPDKATEALNGDNTNPQNENAPQTVENDPHFWDNINPEKDEVLSSQIASADSKIDAENYQGACKVVSIMFNTIDNLQTLGNLKYAKVEIERICGKLGKGYEVYLTVALNHIERRRGQLLAA